MEIPDLLRIETAVLFMNDDHMCNCGDRGTPVTHNSIKSTFCLLISQAVSTS